MATLAGIRPQRYVASTFAAFRVCEIGKGYRTYPAGDLGEPESVEAAVAIAQHGCHHKERLVIRETDEAGQIRLHVFAIKKRAPRWVHPAGELMPRRVEDLYADPICVIDGAAVLS